MSIINLNLKSMTLLTNVNISVIISDTYVYENDYKKLKVLYMLHGMGDDNTSYVRNTNIESYINGKDIAVVCPSVGNSFYANMNYGSKYYDYIVKELPLMIARLLPISFEKEDTFIGGLSMGGYGALRAGIKENLYSGIGVMSAGIDKRIMLSDTEKYSNFNPKSIFGEKLDIEDNDYDIFYLAKNNKFSSRVFILCGREDIFYESNKLLSQILKEKSIECTFKQVDGGHQWNVWDQGIKDMIDWIYI